MSNNLAAKRRWFAHDTESKPRLEVVLYAPSASVPAGGGLAALQSAGGLPAVRALPATSDACITLLCNYDEVWCLPLTGYGRLNKSRAARIYYCAQVSASIAAKFKLIECKVNADASLFINVKPGADDATESASIKPVGNKARSREQRATDRYHRHNYGAYTLV